MFSVSAEYYDLLYSTFKDYAAEADRIAALARQASLGCRTVLDVACGTGEHARLLARRGFEVDGLDLSPAFLRVARAKHPGGRFFEADMSGFRLPRRYDVVLCLFSSIGYLTTIDRVTAALVCFRDHLSPGGVVMVEPWFRPGVLDPTRVTTNVGEGDGVRVVRTARVAIEGRLSQLFFEYEITNATGTRHVKEVHELGLYTTEELLGAFQHAGLEVSFDPEGLTDNRGLYLARRADRP
jgi:SAM-dependent methyltransferase